LVALAKLNKNNNIVSMSVLYWAFLRVKLWC